MSARILRTRSGRELRRLDDDEDNKKGKKDPVDNDKEQDAKLKNSKPATKIETRGRGRKKKLSVGTEKTKGLDKNADIYPDAEVVQEKLSSVEESNSSNYVHSNDTLSTNENDETKDETKDDFPVKRKRGRPRKSDNIPHVAARKTETNVVEKNSFTEPPVKKQKNSTSVEKATAKQRKPRMASLNALAKVNAVLECYRPDSKKELQEQIKEIDKNCQKRNEKLASDKKREVVKLPSVEELDENVFEEVVNLKPVENVNDLDIKPQIETIKDETLCPVNVKLSDQCSQTEHCKTKQTQTEELRECMNTPADCLCTCPLPRSDVFPYYAPTLPYNYLTNPIHMKSNTLVHTKSHTLAVPIVKKHIIWDKDSSLYQSGDLTEKVSQLVSSCLTNTLMKNSIPCSQLMYLASYKNEAKKEHKNPTKANVKNVQKKPEKTSKKTRGLSVPNLNFADISVPPTSQLNNDAKKVEKQRTPKKSKIKKEKEKEKEKEREKLVLSKRERCNGWEFEGIPVEESMKQNGVQVKRRYYQGLKRNNEELKIHDAVILKSGNEDDADYVARITALWEDSNGIYDGDMMMSVFWYYKPEQTNGKSSDIKGEEEKDTSQDVDVKNEMEVFASRHKDDNSVACILERCYVVAFPQFCRFRAQQLIRKQQRKQKTTSLVPEAKKSRSRFIPSPDTDPSLVFFCRHGYDFRLGKILKSF